MLECLIALSLDTIFQYSKDLQALNTVYTVNDLFVPARAWQYACAKWRWKKENHSRFGAEKDA